MYSVNLTENFPTSNNLIFINRDTKKFIHVNLDVASDKIEAVISKSEDGINLQFPVINEPVVDALPFLSGHLANASLRVIKHFSDNGFTLLDTISSTKMD
jgi:hypothetical protein